MHDAYIYISADVQRITSNASCMAISGGRPEQLDIFCRITGCVFWLYKATNPGSLPALLA